MSAPTILISGCSSGIGLAVAEGLRARGYRVFASARKAADVVRLGRLGFEAVELDVADSTSIDRAVTAVFERTGGRLDALFNNAGYGQPGAVEDLSRAALRAQFETNLFGAVELTNRVLPAMRAQRHGRILMNSSLLGYVALAYRGAYNASKFALEGISDTLRLELRGSGIHVCLIEPGPIRSRFRANAYAMYQQHIDKAHSAHRVQYEAMERRLTQAGPVAPFTLGPEAVLRAVVHALESPRPKLRYRVTQPAHYFAWAKRLLSGRMLDRLLGVVSDREAR